MSHRNAQLSGIIRSVIATHALRIQPQTAKIVSVIEVRLSKDLSYADIFISAVDGIDRALEHLAKHKGAIRKELSTKMRVHKLPLLRFHKDELIEQGNRIDDLLATIEPVTQ